MRGLVVIGRGMWRSLREFSSSSELRKWWAECVNIGKGGKRKDSMP